MENRTLELMVYVGNRLGYIKTFNMYDEDNIFIEGKTEEGKKFKLSLTMDKGEEENA